MKKTTQLKSKTTLKAKHSLNRSTKHLNRGYLKANRELLHTKPLKAISDKAKAMWDDLRQFIIDRDKGKCRVCGKPGEQVHHIHLRSKRKDLVYNKNNCILLCNKHHFHQGSLRYKEQCELIAKALNMTVKELLEFAEKGE